MGLWIYNHGLLFGVPAIIVHRTIMTEGFMVAYAVGFLTTALPRLMNTFYLTQVELGLFVLLFGAAVLLLHCWRR